jgi:hypothetical protein
MAAVCANARNHLFTPHNTHNARSKLRAKAPKQPGGNSQVAGLFVGVIRELGNAARGEAVSDGVNLADCQWNMA